MLFAGPYNHEFGHELFSFQGRIRALSKEHTKTIVCSKKCMEFLYKDFADEFIAIESDLDLSKYNDYTFVKQQDCAVSRGTGQLKAKQKFVKYGDKSEEGYDIIFHARTKAPVMCPNLKNETHDTLYNTLKKKYNIAFVGIKEGAYCPSDAKDLRGISLEKLANVFSSSRLVVGQSSGPIHFASLCGTPHLTWGGYRPRTFFRYAYNWNPFKTKCYIFEDAESVGYLKRRAKMFGAPKDLFDAEHLVIVNNKNYKEPSANTLSKEIEGILNG